MPYIATGDQRFICTCCGFQCISRSSHYTNTVEVAVTVQCIFLMLCKNHDVADFLSIFFYLMNTIRDSKLIEMAPYQHKIKHKCLPCA